MKKDIKKMSIKEFIENTGWETADVSDTFTANFGCTGSEGANLEIVTHLPVDEVSNYIASLLNIIFPDGEYHPEFYADATNYLFFKFFIKNMKAPTKKVNGETIEDTGKIVRFMDDYSIIESAMENHEFSDAYSKILQYANKAIEHKKKIIENQACTDNLVFKIKEIQTVLGSRIDMIEEAVKDGTLDQIYSMIIAKGEDLTE